MKQEQKLYVWIKIFWRTELIFFLKLNRKQTLYSTWKAKLAKIRYVLQDSIQWDL